MFILKVKSPVIPHEVMDYLDRKQIYNVTSTYVLNLIFQEI